MLVVLLPPSIIMNFGRIETLIHPLPAAMTEH